ncbi:hypothetical protein [Alteromonas sp. 14N.309.X.WAT.G.H12]|uniref:hypothetical protein n=1 Tax=Alteromonas sp. 14N.309.X.WAT.G.H12 TaxID=3120824 RepID=UPI002FD4EED1
MMLKKALTILGLVTAFWIPTLTASATVITYANCPTLSPLPVTSFMPAALLPIEQAETSFDTGMNAVVAAAVNSATVIQSEAISSAFNTITSELIKISQAKQSNLIEIDRQYQELKMAYEMELNAQKEQLENMLFPGDSSMMEPDEGESRVIDQDSPTYQFVKQMCSAAKMQQQLYSEEIINESKELKSRRSTKIVSNIQAVSSISAAAKQSVDFHYEVFCSEDDSLMGMCDEPSVAPNADMDAYVFMYPTGYRGEENGGTSDDYQTMYTYSAVESLAAYQYIKNLTGTLYMTSPTSREEETSSKTQFVGFYKQALSVISLSTDYMLSVAQVREPINKVGLVVSQLDAINYAIERSKLPDHQRIIASASENGKLLELQKQMALQNQLRLLIMKQKERARQLDAARVAIESTVYSLSD